MQQVGLHLHKKALCVQEVFLRDDFARAAYNRYYYGCFLLVRSNLVALKPKWNSINHKNIPEVLEGQVKQRLSTERRKAHKRQDTLLVHQIDIAISSSIEIAKKMTQAHETRKLADYSPEIRVDFDNSDSFSLAEIDIATARDWHNDIMSLLRHLSDVWKQFDENP